MKLPSRAAITAAIKKYALIVWHVPAVESVIGTLIIRWLTVIGVPSLISTAIYESGKAIIG
jgi:hypothetical protein